MAAAINQLTLEEVEAERARVKALQDEIAQLKRELASTPNRPPRTPGSLTTSTPPASPARVPVAGALSSSSPAPSSNRSLSQTPSRLSVGSSSPLPPPPDRPPSMSLGRPDSPQRNIVIRSSSVKDSSRPSSGTMDPLPADRRGSASRVAPPVTPAQRADALASRTAGQPSSASSGFSASSLIAPSPKVAANLPEILGEDESEGLLSGSFTPYNQAVPAVIPASPNLHSDQPARTGSGHFGSFNAANLSSIPSSSGFSAASLLTTMNSDEAEMLRGDAGAPAGVDSFTNTGLLPSSTPAAMAMEGSREKSLDRVEDDLVHFSKNFQIMMKGGTVEKIIEKLTAESQADNSVVDTFLLTYRKFISPENLLERLFERYNLKPPRPLSEMDPHSVGMYDHSLKVIRLRVGNFIKRWLSEHFQDFRANDALIDRLAGICRQTFMVNERSLGEKILNTLEEQKQDWRARDRSNTVTRTARPEAILPKSSSFDDFDLTEVARQLCLFEQSIFRQIHPKECLDQCWSKPDRYNRAPFVMKLIDFFNQFSNWVATYILKQTKLEDRVREVKRFIRLAIELRNLNNFNGCQEVLAGLNDSAIYRLRATWLKVEKDSKLMEEFDVVKSLLSPDKNWAIYRNMLKEIQPPCIPYLGTYLTDLTFIEDGNPNYLATLDGRTDIINFEKCRKQAVVIGNILLYQQDMYQFDKVDPIYNYFGNGLSYTDDKDTLHRLSRQVEPPELVEEAKRKSAKKAEKAGMKRKDSSANLSSPAKPSTSTTPAKSSPTSSRSQLSSSNSRR